MHQISGVEYVYSTSSPGQSLVIVRFLVGTPQEDALIKVYSKLYSNFDQHAARSFAADHQGALHRRRADSVAHAVGPSTITAISFAPLPTRFSTTSSRSPMFRRRTVIGGLPRTMRVVLSTAKLNAYGLSPMTIVGHLQAANAESAGWQLF